MAYNVKDDYDQDEKSLNASVTEASSATGNLDLTSTGQNFYIIADSGGGNVDVKLPSCSTTSLGKMYAIFCKSSSNTARLKTFNDRDEVRHGTNLSDWSGGETLTAGKTMWVICASQGTGTQLKIRVRPGYNGVNANSTLAFNVDHDGTGGPETYTLTFTKPGSGTSSTAFINRTASIRIDEGVSAEALANTIRTIFANAPSAGNGFNDATKWTVGNVFEDTVSPGAAGDYSFELQSVENSQDYRFNTVTADVNSDGQIFGTSVNEAVGEWHVMAEFDGTI